MKKLLFPAIGITFVLLMGFTPIHKYMENSGVTKVGEHQYAIEEVNTISDEDNAQLKTIISNVYGIDMPSDGNVRLDFLPNPTGYSIVRMVVCKDQLSRGCLINGNPGGTGPETSIEDILKVYL